VRRLKFSSRYNELHSMFVKTILASIMMACVMGGKFGSTLGSAWDKLGTGMSNVITTGANLAAGTTAALAQLGVLPGETAQAETCVEQGCNRPRSTSKPHLCEGLHRWITNILTEIDPTPLGEDPNVLSILKWAQTCIPLAEDARNHLSLCLSGFRTILNRHGMRKTFKLSPQKEALLRDKAASTKDKVTILQVGHHHKLLTNTLTFKADEAMFFQYLCLELEYYDPEELLASIKNHRRGLENDKQSITLLDKWDSRISEVEADNKCTEFNEGDKVEGFHSKDKQWYDATVGPKKGLTPQCRYAIQLLWDNSGNEIESFVRPTHIRPSKKAIAKKTIEAKWGAVAQAYNKPTITRGSNICARRRLLKATRRGSA